MRNLKRALSLALASVMLVGMMVVGTSAASYPDVSSEDNVEAISVLNAVEVMIGDENGDFNPSEKVTRAQMAVVMAKLMLGGYEADSYVGSHPFADVPSWAQRYVAACYNAGIIAGRGEGVYDPNSPVTAVEAAAMMLRALGYEDLSLGAAQWDQPVAAKANQIELFNGLTGNGNAQLTRNDVAKLALNTLKATMVTTERTGQDITIPGGIEISGTRTYTERTTDRYNYTTGSAPVSGEDKNLQLCEYLYGNDLTLTDDEDGLGRPASLWQYKGEDVVKTAKASWKSMVINPDDAATIGNVATSKDYFDLKASNVDASVEYKLNGDDKTTSEALKSGDVVELFRNDSNKVTDVIVTRYALAQVSKVDDDVSSADAKKGTSCYVSLKALNGTSMGNYNDNDFAGFNAADYTEDTFVAIAQNGESEIVASHAAKVVEGKVTAYKSGKVITLDGDKYNLVNGLAAGSVTSFDFDNSEFALYMTENDYVLAIDGVEGVKLDDVYYVHSAYYTKSGNGNTNFYAQVVDMEGVEDEIQIEATTYVNTFGLDAAQANSFGAVQKLYTFTDKDNKSGANNANGDAIANGSSIDNVVDPKANNGKFSAKKYVGSADFEVASAGSDALDTLAAEVNSSSKTVKVTTGGFGEGDRVQSAYINENTKFVLIGTNATTATNAELDISTSVGSAKVATGKKAFVIASKEGSSYEAAAVIVADTGVSEGVSSDKVLYLTGAATNEVKGGYETTVYFMDGTNETVTIDAAGDKGFYTYDVNKDGVYELGGAPDNVTLGVGAIYDDETGVITPNPIVSIRKGQYITFTTDGFENITLSEDLQVVDVRSGRENHAYTQKITDLSKLEAAMDRGGAGSVTVTAYVDDGEVKLISVTAMDDTRSAVTTVASAKAVKASDAGASLTVTEEAEVDNTEHTIKVTIGGTATDGDKITVTATATNSEATVSGTATLTYTAANTTWTASGDITVTAENGDTQAYTVSVKVPDSAAPSFNTDLTETTKYYAKGASLVAGDALTVAATATDGTISYQWQSKGSAVDAEWEDMTGKEAATLAQADISVAAAGTTQYRCVVTNTEDGKTPVSIESKVVTVSVIDITMDGALSAAFTGASDETVTKDHAVDNIADGETVTLKWYNNDSSYATEAETRNLATHSVGAVADGKVVLTLTEDSGQTVAAGTYYYTITYQGVVFQGTVEVAT